MMPEFMGRPDRYWIKLNKYPSLSEITNNRSFKSVFVTDLKLLLLVYAVATIGQQSHNRRRRYNMKSRF